MKKIFSSLVFTIAGINFLFAQCLPEDVNLNINTGVNMTVMVTSTFIDGLDLDENQFAVIVAVSDGIIIGKEDLTNISQTALSIWGDDTSTDEVDGAATGANVDLYLITDDSWSTLSGYSISYTTNGLAVLDTSPTVELNDGCFYGCNDQEASNYDLDGSSIILDNASCSFGTPGTPISYPINEGWNMVAYTGPATNNGIETQMELALENGSDAQTTFTVIKDVTGAFWNQFFQQITHFVQGEGYMMYVQDGQATSLNFQKSDNAGIPSTFSYPLIEGWNMVGYTGDVNSELDIELAMQSALQNGSDAQTTFTVIKDVTGAFWNQFFQQITHFVPGEAYMMYVQDGQATSVSFN